MSIIKKHIHTIIEESGITDPKKIKDYIFNEGWDQLKSNLLKEGKISDFFKRVKQQKREVDEYKRKNPDKPLGSVEDFERFKKENEKLKAGKKIVSITKEGMWDNFKKGQKEIFKRKTQKLIDKQKRIDSGQEKEGFIDKAIGKYMKRGRKKEQYAKMWKQKRDQIALAKKRKKRKILIANQNKNKNNGKTI